VNRVWLVLDKKVSAEDPTHCRPLLVLYLLLVILATLLRLPVARNVFNLVYRSSTRHLHVKPKEKCVWLVLDKRAYADYSIRLGCFLLLVLFLKLDTLVSFLRLLAARIVLSLVMAMLRYRLVKWKDKCVWPVLDKRACADFRILSRRLFLVPGPSKATLVILFAMLGSIRKLPIPFV